jgi:hypothetical protein
VGAHLHSPVSLLQTPLPDSLQQLFGQGTVGMAQSKPVHVESHEHDPVSTWQVPWPVQPLGQGRMERAQLRPCQLSSQVQVPES